MARKLSVRTQPFWLIMLEGLVLIVAILYFAKLVLIPLALAILLTFVLTPIVVAVQRSGLGRVPSVLTVVCLAFLLLGAIGWGVGLQIQGLAPQLPALQEKIKQRIDNLRSTQSGLLGQLIRLSGGFSNDTPAPSTAEPSKGEVRPVLPTEPGKAFELGKDRVVIVAETDKHSATERLFTMVEPILEPLAIAGLVIILVVFMLINREDLRNRMISLLGHGHLTGTTRVLVDAAERLGRFLLSQLLVNASFGLVFGIMLFFLQVPYAFLWAFLTALLRFVPYVGTWIAVAFPLLLSIANTDTWTQPVLLLALFAVLDVLTANVIEPLVFGHSTGVAPIALLIAAAFWSWLWGPIGLVLSTPLTLCLVVLGQHIPRFKFLTLLLGDQPALPPHASYYQRLLARDRDEALDVVRQYVAAHGPEKVYDGVFLPALALTRRDRKFGGLTAEEEEFIYQTTREILEQLAAQAAPPASEEKAGAAPAEATKAAVPAPEEEATPSVLLLGCPAHHQAEELSLQMLAQLLKPDHYHVEVVSTKVLPSEIEAEVAQEKPALVFVAVLPPGGIIQASYLCRRLRRRFPDLPILVGYWGEVHDFDRLLVRLRSAGAGYLTTSLLQGQSQIRALAAPPPAPAKPVLQAAGQH